MLTRTPQHAWQHATAHIERLAASTTDAYSFHYYGERQWRECCALLLTLGYHPIEADAILRSKLTRLAADDRRRPDRHATALDLGRFLARMPADELRAWIDECIVNINFPEPEKLNSRDALHLVWSR